MHCPHYNHSNLLKSKSHSSTFVEHNLQSRTQAWPLPPSPALTEIRLWLILTMHTSLLSGFHSPFTLSIHLPTTEPCTYLSSPFGAPFLFSSLSKYLLICHFLKEAFPDYLVIDSQSTMYPPSSAFRYANFHLFG